MENTIVIKKDQKSNGAIKKSVRFLQDGWQNLMTRVGLKSHDKSVNTTFAAEDILSESDLSALYRGDGLTKKIITIPADDMIRRWFSIEGDSENAVIKALDKIGTRQAVKEAIKWSRLYGGALLVMGIDDGQKGTIKDRNQLGKSVLEKPLNEENINEIGFFRVYVKEQVFWETTDLDNDPSSENYGKPLIYTIRPIIEQSADEFRIHHTRVIRFIGETLSEREASRQRWWGDSVIQSVFTRLRGFANALKSTEAIIDDFTVNVMEIRNLQALIAAGQEDAISKRLAQVDQSKHVMNTFLVDAEEKFTRHSASVNGIKDILEFDKDVLSAVAGIPQLKLFGEQSKGLGSQAAGNIRLYYDDISEKQEFHLRPPLERIVSLLLKSKSFRTLKQNIKDNWNLVFISLYQESNKEQAESRLLIAKADDIYLKNKVLSQEEVAESRFDGDTYSPDTKLIEAASTERKKLTEKLSESMELGKVENDPDQNSENNDEL